LVPCSDEWNRKARNLMRASVVICLESERAKVHL